MTTENEAIDDENELRDAARWNLLVAADKLARKAAAWTEADDRQAVALAANALDAAAHAFAVATPRAPDPLQHLLAGFLAGLEPKVKELLEQHFGNLTPAKEKPSA